MLVTYNILEQLSAELVEKFVGNEGSGRYSRVDSTENTVSALVLACLTTLQGSDWVHICSFVIHQALLLTCLHCVTLHEMHINPMSAKPCRDET